MRQSRLCPPMAQGRFAALLRDHGASFLRLHVGRSQPLSVRGGQRSGRNRRNSPCGLFRGHKKYGGRRCPDVENKGHPQCRQNISARCDLVPCLCWFPLVTRFSFVDNTALMPTRKVDYLSKSWYTVCNSKFLPFVHTLSFPIGLN